MSSEITLRPMENAFEVRLNGAFLGVIETRRNPFHGESCYLTLRLDRMECDWAEALFSALHARLGCPLQVMASSEERALADFLLAGGFVRKRRCFEMEVSRADLAAEPVPAALQQAEQGSPAYEKCAHLLYDHYARTHRAVNPLTASFEEFQEILPDTVLCASDHYAFVDENEIAYVGAGDMETFPAFLRGLLHEMFSQFETVCFECDDCDPAAMALRACFVTEEQESFDTYMSFLSF